MRTSVSIKKRVLLVLLLIGVIISVMAFIQLWNNNQGVGDAGDTLDPAFLFYRDLGARFRDCGNETLNLGFGYNKNMRTCFEEAHNSCTEVKLHQKIYTVEGDPVFTTVVIEGDAPEGCAVHVYVDNRDRFGSFGMTDTVCYTTTFDRSSGQYSLLLTECDDGTTQYFY